MSTTTSRNRSQKDRIITVINRKSPPIVGLYLGVYISGPREDAWGFPQMFSRAGCFSVESPEQADLVVFTGGSDVNPMLYGQKPHHTTHWDDARDAADIKLFSKCLEQGIPMLGVCRGAQFLHVMMGGSLYQDVDQHNGDHHIFLCDASRSIHPVSSVHHQAVMRKNAPQGFKCIAETRRSTKRAIAPSVSEMGGGFPDVEAFTYKQHMIFGVQGHPEYSGYNDFAAWVCEVLDSMFESADIDKTKHPRRIKASLVTERLEKHNAFMKERLKEIAN